MAVDKGIKLVLLVRNPVEVMSSWINAPKEFDVKWNADEQLINARLKNIGRKENFYGLDAWVQTTRLFERLAKSYSKRVILVDYSTLQSSLLQTVWTSQTLLDTY